MRVNDLPRNSFGQLGKGKATKKEVSEKSDKSDAVVLAGFSDESDGELFADLGDESHLEGREMPVRTSVEEPGIVCPGSVSSDVEEASESESARGVEESFRNEAIQSEEEENDTPQPDGEATIPWQEEVTLPYELDVEPQVDSDATLVDKPDVLSAPTRATSL